LLYYSESDRVSAAEPVIRARKPLGDDEYVNLRIVIDSLTGSSANGAIPTDAPQTFTSPSGERTYTTPANRTPLDPSFLDTRFALNAEWEKPLTRTLRGVFGFNGSKEYDYTSVGVSATLARDFNNRNTTISGGLSYNADTVDPVGGAPLGLSAVPTSVGAPKQTLSDSEGKNVTELLLGWTQVIDRKTLMQFNYSFGKDDGYLTDPYKLLSVVDGATGVLAATPYLYEKRPDSRTRQSLYWKTRHQFSEDVLTTVYRYYRDDWGVQAHTVDLRYRWELGGGHYLQPHLRYARQNAADFYRYFLIDGQTPEFASADYRLGDMTTTTFGVKYGVALARNREFGVRLEVMQQSGEGRPAEAIGVTRNQDLYPTVDAVIFQLSYSFLW
jgi:hypothetical protein